MRIQTDGEPRNSGKIASLLKLLEITQEENLSSDGRGISQTTPLGMLRKQSLLTKIYGLRNSFLPSSENV